MTIKQQKQNDQRNKKHEKSKNIQKVVHPSIRPKKSGNIKKKSVQKNSLLQKRAIKQIQTQQNDQHEQAFDASNNMIRSSQKGKHYEDLLEQSGKGFKRQKNLYFLQNQRYMGKNNKQSIQREQNFERSDYDEQDNFIQEQNDSQGQNIDEKLSQDVEEDVISQGIDQDQDFGQDNQQNFSQQDNAQQSPQNQNQIQQALNLLKSKRKQTSSLLKQKIQLLQKQDRLQSILQKQQKSKSSSQQHEQAKQLKKLLEVFDHLVQLRYNQQKELQDIKGFPKVDEQEGTYPVANKLLRQANQKLEAALLANLSQLVHTYQSLASKCAFVKENQQTQDQNQENALSYHSLAELINNQSHSDQSSLNLDKIYNLVKSTINPINSQVQKQLIKWSQKTSFMSSSTSSSQYNSLIMQTPIGQATKVLSNWQRMSSKCQQKRGKTPFKILFQTAQNIHQSSDSQIYDDYDLFIQLEKYYLEKLDNDEDGEFLQSSTMKYLKNRQANQLNKQANKKDVDRKASKNRKIRYNVHPKLLNFMPTRQQNCIETRDQIVKNIFNCNASSIETQVHEDNATKSKYLHNMDNEEDYIEVA